MVAHAASPTGAIVVDTPVEGIQILTDQSEEPVEMLISSLGEPVNIYLWHFGLDQLPDFAAQLALLDDTANQIRIRSELQLMLHLTDRTR